MLAVSQGRTLALSTPWGRRGWWHSEWEQGEDWDRLRIDATMCPRISKRFLDQERCSLPRLWFASEYMRQFVDTEDQVFLYTDIMAAVTDAPLLFGGSL